MLARPTEGAQLPTASFDVRYLEKLCSSVSGLPIFTALEPIEGNDQEDDSGDGAEE